MIDRHRTTIVLGPPGTGKTTHLLERVSDALRSGVPPSEIAYLSFSQRAAREAVDRATAQFGLPSEALPYFRTLHSLAFRAVGASTTQIVRTSHIHELGNLLNLDVTGVMPWEDRSARVQATKADRALHMAQLARIRCVDLTEQWESDRDRLSYYYVDRLASALNTYKAQRGLYDFTDLLYEFHRRGACPPLHTLIIDEAQDLSTIQWACVERLARTAKEIWIAGDDDQAIYGWAGSDVDYFLRLEGREQILRQSYRVPISVQRVAGNVIDRISRRRPKAWAPRNEEGEVSHLAHPADLDLSTGQWLVLARNRYLLDEIAAVCRRHGYYYSYEFSPSISRSHLAAITTWEDIRSSRYVSADQLAQVLPLISPKKFSGGQRGKKALAALPAGVTLTVPQITTEYGLSTTDIWHVALDMLPPLVCDYVVAALKRGEKLKQEPRIRLSTIHAAKGAEADQVAVLSDMASRTYREGLRYPEAEARVWYVAVTRAKQRLVVVAPQTAKHYRL